MDSSIKVNERLQYENIDEILSVRKLPSRYWMGTERESGGLSIDFDTLFCWVILDIVVVRDNKVNLGNDLPTQHTPSGLI